MEALAPAAKKPCSYCDRRGAAMLTLKEAHALLSLLVDRDRIVFEGEAKDRFTDCLESMLGGDPWQEGSAAMEILEILHHP